MMVNYELPSKGQLFSNFDYIRHEDRVSAGEIIFFSLTHFFTRTPSSPVSFFTVSKKHMNAFVT